MARKNYEEIIEERANTTAKKINHAIEFGKPSTTPYLEKTFKRMDNLRKAGVISNSAFLSWSAKYFNKGVVSSLPSDEQEYIKLTMVEDAAYLKKMTSEIHSKFKVLKASGKPVNSRVIYLNKLAKAIDTKIHSFGWFSTYFIEVLQAMSSNTNQTTCRIEHSILTPTMKQCMLGIYSQDGNKRDMYRLIMKRG